MSCITDAVNRISSEIAEAARISGRTRSDITFLVAAKTQSAASVREAVLAGADAIGENRVQELTAKLAEGAYAGVRLDFIGSLQTNKVKYVVGEAALIHSVGSEHLAHAISDGAVKKGVVQPVLIEVNIGLEGTKSGVMPKDISALAETIIALPSLSLRGLMAIPPFTESPERYFAAMRALFKRLKDQYGKGIDTLSMGMSHDYISAVKEGSTLVRIGTAVFGPRVKT